MRVETPRTAEQPFRIWAMECPFRRSGSPVMGTFGATAKPVVVMTTETWARLVQRIPELKTMQFEVGTFDEG